MSGRHTWCACSHARPTYCNICREALSGLTSHGLSCEVCKFKTHKRCVVRVSTQCKWTCLASMGKDILEDDGISMPHQWLEGNLPVSAKCAVCDKTCGNVLRLQDYKCLWCQTMIHTACRTDFNRTCHLGQCRFSVLPPTNISCVEADGFWEGTCSPGSSPLLVFVNSKSGDNQGFKFLGRFKHILNPAQVFDLMNGGPCLGLKLFQKFNSFRILVCGGDGSVGWVLSEMDKLNLHKQCQVGVLPFGTGNDLARVLGWGSTFDDDTQLPAALEKLEHSQIKMLDRWSIWTYDDKLPSKQKLSHRVDPIFQYENSIIHHMMKILHSDDHSVVIASAKVLCEAVRDFVGKVSKVNEGCSEKEHDDMASKESLQQLQEMEDCSTAQEHSASINDVLPDSDPAKPNNAPAFKSREALMSRANSLKKALRQIIEHTERALDEQNTQTLDILENLPLDMSSCKGESSSAPSFLALSNLYEDSKVPTSSTMTGVGCNILKSMGGSGLISKVLLDNADALCAAASPLLEQGVPLELFQEKCVMNNYLGIGLDAKVVLEFQNKRDEHPKKCRSRTRNMLWYGVLGGREMLNRTYRNLEQRVLLECDGQQICLPSLQGIVVMNITSYSGGTNFWGGSKQDEYFISPSFDDKILEVVAVFGSMQMAMSRIIDLRHHRIAQWLEKGKGQDGDYSNSTHNSHQDMIRPHLCSQVKITILGGEPVPVQVDGEPWLQPPGCIRILHKNRAMMLTRDRTLENTFKMWSEKHKLDRPSSLPVTPMWLDELIWNGLMEASSHLIGCIYSAPKSTDIFGKDLLMLAQASSRCIDWLTSNAVVSESALRTHLASLLGNIKLLYNATSSTLNRGEPILLLWPDLERRLASALSSLDVALRKFQTAGSPSGNMPGPADFADSRVVDGKVSGWENSHLAAPLERQAFNIRNWTAEEVGSWLEGLSLGHYRNVFISHEIRGTELLSLERRDIKDLGVNKIGHLKRIQEGIKELQYREAAYDQLPL